MDTSMNLNDASIAHSEPSRFDGDSMDVSMDVDEVSTRVERGVSFG